MHMRHVRVQSGASSRPHMHAHVPSLVHARAHMHGSGGPRVEAALEPCAVAPQTARERLHTARP
jgi:hypothetical protein